MPRGERNHTCTDCLEFVDDMHAFEECVENLVRQRSELRGCVGMLLRCAVPNAKDHPTMWDTWGDASALIGDDRNAHLAPHVNLQGDARACTKLRRMARLKHFCEDPRQALCGELTPRFPDGTSNAFKCVTCPTCRDKIRETRFTPGGFADPEEWGPKMSPKESP